MVSNLEYIIIPSTTRIVLPSRGYFTRGDSGESIGVISSFLACNFMGYANKLNERIDDMLGYYFGDHLFEWVKEFQRNNNLEDDGNIGPVTLETMRQYGLSL